MRLALTYAVLDGEPQSWRTASQGGTRPVGLRRAVGARYLARERDHPWTGSSRRCGNARADASSRTHFNGRHQGRRGRAGSQHTGRRKIRVENERRGPSSRGHQRDRGIDDAPPATSFFSWSRGLSRLGGSFLNAIYSPPKPVSPRSAETHANGQHVANGSGALPADSVGTGNILQQRTGNIGQQIVASNTSSPPSLALDVSI